MSPGREPIHEILRRRAQEAPNRRAFAHLEDGERLSRWVTVGELDARARSIAAEMQRHGAQGERALLLYPSGLDFVAGFFGTLYAGAIPVPAYPPDPARLARSVPRLRDIAADARARFVLAPDVPQWRADVADQETWRDAIWLATAGCDEGDGWEPPEPVDGDLAYLQYTSGSTAVPKGVMVTHENVTRHAEALGRRWELDEAALAVSWLPNFHDMGLITGVLAPVCLGHPAVSMAPLDFVRRPARWLQAISDLRGTVAASPNFGFELCLRKVTAAERAALDLRSWRVVCNGAEPIRASTLGRFVEVFGPAGFRPETMRPSYGLAEATLVVSTSAVSTGAPHTIELDPAAFGEGRVESVVPGSSSASRSVVGCGTALDGEDLAIVDPATGVEVGRDRVGEVWASGPSVAAGYWGRPEDTEATFGARVDGRDGRWLRTGDLGFSDADGRLFLTGRLKDLVIVAGRNVYPQDVEWTTEDAHEAVRPGCSAVFATELPGGGEGLGVAFEIAADSDPEPVLAAVRGAVAEAHGVTPSILAALAPGALPKTSSGKIQRRRCREELAAGRLDEVARTETTVDALGSADGPTAGDETQRASERPGRREVAGWLVGAIARRLGVAQSEVEPARPLAEHGLGSMALVDILGELEARFGEAVPADRLYEHPTVDALAGYVAGEQPVSRPSARRAAPGGASAVAIVGMACRFPGADSPERFWEILRDGEDPVTEVPPDRWDIDAFYDPEGGRLGTMSTRRGGFVDGIDLFDASFFGIGPRDARSMDPQQRMLLELSWEAIEHAGIAPATLSHAACGVYVGVATWDYFDRIGKVHARDVTGNALSASANRISYMLDLHGPSVALDTACSSALVALAMGTSSLRTGECDAALVGGVNAILNPEYTSIFSQSGAIAPDGACKTFDANADGYVRSEGCGMVLLKRLEDAEADGDRVLAVLRGIAVNNDGRSNGFTAPNGLAHREVQRRAIEQAGIRPADVSFVEAHGTATPLGDPVEVHALASVLRRAEFGDRTCHLGSVKASIGHLEPAAGVASLIKLALMFEHDAIPPQLHLREVNPALNLEETPFHIPTALTPWDTGGRPRIAGINGFGAGGTNVHAIVEQPPPPPPSVPSGRTFQILPVSARKPGALRELLAAHADALGAPVGPTPEEYCVTAACGRTHFDERAAVVFASATGAESALRALGADDAPPPPGAARGLRSRGDEPRIAFLFPGQGSAFPGMGRSLYETEPAFREALDRCSESLGDRLGWPLTDVLWPRDEQPWELLGRTELQPAVFAFEYAMAQMWIAWGIRPHAMLGHSLGEYVAACVAGCCGLDDALALTAERGRVQQDGADAAPGAMAAVLAGADEVTGLVAPWTEQVSVAAYNGPQTTIVSGRRPEVEEVVAAAAGRGLMTQSFASPGAAHSPMITADLMHRLRDRADEIPWTGPTIPVVSNLTGRPIDTPPDGVHWARHMREPVDFVGGVRALRELGCDTFLEVGPGATLGKLVRRSIEDDVPRLVTVRRDHDDGETAFRTLGQLYALGAPVDWDGVHAGVRARRVSIPRYRFQRRSFWGDRHVPTKSQTTEV